MALTSSSTTQALVDAHAELWHTTYGFVKSMALKSALDLGIVDAIHHHGGYATLTQIATTTKVPDSKVRCLHRLMRVLTTSGIFSVRHPDNSDGEQVYGLTPASQLLVGSSNMTPTIASSLDSAFVSPLLGLGAWFRQELPENHSLFEMRHGLAVWDFIDQNPAFGARFNEGMVSDSIFLMDIVTNECSFIFQGISSLVDVAGGLGGAAQAIATSFPHVACTVLDRPHVVANAPTGTQVEYIAGDMFERIPPANAIFLKSVLHDWGDVECVKILKNCKKAIPRKEEGGKVIILDMVIGAGGTTDNVKRKHTQVLFDLSIMCFNGVERDEQEWKKIISEAGFSDYKIIPELGVRSIIEVNP